jgi:hypothetical protein
MAWKIDDRALWLGLGLSLSPQTELRQVLMYHDLGVFAFVAVRAVSYALHETLRLTEIHEEPRKNLCPVSQDTEDAIKAESLSVLAKSQNLDIQHA